MDPFLVPISGPQNLIFFALFLNPVLFFSGALELAVRLLRSYSGLNSSVCWWQIRLTHAHGGGQNDVEVLVFGTAGKAGKHCNQQQHGIALLCEGFPSEPMSAACRSLAMSLAHPR